MPPSVTQNNASSNRRSTGSMRQRENRTDTQHLQTSSGSGRRRKSRSPATRPNEDLNALNDLARRRKKLPPLPVTSSSASNMGVVRSSMIEDDRGRTKTKPKPRAVTMWIDDNNDDTPIVTNIVQDQHRPPNAQSSRSKRKERSRSREASHRHCRKTATPEPDEDEGMYTGPLAHAEYTRMKQEMEGLRKVRHLYGM